MILRRNFIKSLIFCFNFLGRLGPYTIYLRRHLWSVALFVTIIIVVSDQEETKLIADHFHMSFHSPDYYTKRVFLLWGDVLCEPFLNFQACRISHRDLNLSRKEPA